MLKFEANPQIKNEKIYKFKKKQKNKWQEQTLKSKKPG